MKKVLFAVFALILTVPALAFAHLYDMGQFEDTYDIGTRVEVSKDSGATWFSYDSSDDPALGTGQTLTASPGDTLTFRVRVWNEGNTVANNVVGVGTETSFSYLSNVSGVFDNPDADGNSQNITGGSIDTINIASLASGGSATSGEEMATFTGKVKSDVPNGTVIKMHYEITSASHPVITFNPSAVWYSLVPKAMADSDGTAVTEARVQVSNPTPVAVQTQPAVVQELPRTGTAQTGYVFLVVGLMGSFFAGRLVRQKVENS